MQYALLAESLVQFQNSQTYPGRMVRRNISWMHRLDVGSLDPACFFKQCFDVVPETWSLSTNATDQHRQSMQIGKRSRASFPSPPLFVTSVRSICKGSIISAFTECLSPMFACNQTRTSQSSGVREYPRPRSSHSAAAQGFRGRAARQAFWRQRSRPRSWPVKT